MSLMTMSPKAPDVCLTLVIPPSLEDALVDFLLAHPDQVGHFTSRPVDAHGGDIRYGSTSEQVRGRALRLRIQALMAGADVHQLLDDLRDQLPGADIYYWTAPVLQAGRLS